MKKIKKILTVGLAAMLGLLAFCSCKNETEDAPKKQSGTNASKIVSTYGKHDHNFSTQTSRLFVNGGLSEYVVVVPSDMPDMGEYALSEMKYFVRLATGATIETVSDATKLSDGQKFISLGKTKQLEQKGWKLDGDRYKTSGFAIKSDDGNVYIYSAFVNDNYNGVLCGVYEFLKHTVGLEIYTDEIFDYRKTSTVYMPDFDVEEIPDFDERKIGGIDDYHYSNCLRLLTNTDGTKFPMSGHSQLAILQLSEEWKSHSDWVSADGEVLCYSSWKTGMDEEYAKNVILLFEQNPEIHHIFMGVPDVTTPCACTRCMELRAEHNTNASGTMIIFLNKVIERVIDYFAKNDPDRYVTFGTFAYEGVVAAPCHYNETTGTWEADSPDVIPHERLSIKFCPIGSTVTQPLTASANESDYNSYLGWNTIASDLSSFMYPYYIKGATVTCPQNQVFSENIRLFAQGKMSSYYDEVISASSVFYNLQRYVESKMLWDVNYSYDELARKFIAYVYGDAAEAIQDYYDYLIVWSTEALADTSTYATQAAKLYNDKVFSERALNVWDSCLNRAYDALEKADCDEDRYREIKGKIDFLYFVTNVNRVEVYYSKMNDSERAELVGELQGIYYSLKFAKFMKGPQEQSYSSWFALRG